MLHHPTPHQLVTTLALAAGLCLGSFRLGTDARLRADETPIATIEHPDPVDFQREVLPILRKKCLACHNQTDAEGDLVLETPETILKGGVEGPAVVAGSPDESRLLALASHRDEPVMPPEDNSAGAEPMTPDELGLLKLWIEQGAQGVVATAAKSIRWQALPAEVNPVFAAAQSSDGRLIVVGRANQAWIYDLLLGEYVDRLTDPSLADSPVANGHPLAHLDLVQSLAFSRDGQWIASGGYRTLKLWKRAPAVEGLSRLNVATITATAHHGDNLHYLADETGQIHGVRGHDMDKMEVVHELGGRIHALAVAPNGNFIASSGDDHAVRIWTNQHELAGTFEQPCRVHQLAWLTDNLLAGACDDHMVRIWSIDQAGSLGAPCLLAAHTQPVTAIAPLPNNRLVTASDDGVVRIWNFESGEYQREMNHGAPLTGLATIRSTDRLVTFGGEGPAKLWNTESGEVISELGVDAQLQWHYEQLSLAQQIAQRHVDNLNQDLETAKKRITEEEQNLTKDLESRDKAKDELEKSQEPAETAARERQQAQDAIDMAKAKLAAAEQVAADAADEGAQQAAVTEIESIKMQISDAENALKAKMEAADKAAKQLAEHKETLETSEQSVAISEQAVADAKAVMEEFAPQLQAATECKEEAEQVTKAVEDRLQSERHVAQRAIISDDGSLIATIDGHGGTALWRASDGRPIQIEQIEPVPAEPVISLAFGPDRSLRVLTTEGRVFNVHLTARWQLFRTIGAPDETSCFADRVTALSFSPNDQLLAIGGGQPSRGGELKIYRVDDGEVVREFPEAHSDTLLGVAFSPDGNQLASCGADRFMKVFDVATGNLIRTFEGHTHHVLSVSWRADGRVLATGGADSVVKIWNATDGSQVRTIQDFGKEVTAVQFAGADEHFYAACGDQHLYRCNMAGERKSIGSGQDFLYVVSASLLGKSVAFAGHDSIVRVVDDNGGSLAELEPTEP